MQARCNFFWIQMAENSGQKKEIRHGAMEWTTRQRSCMSMKICGIVKSM
jgi:hypothetical protein